MSSLTPNQSNIHSVYLNFITFRAIKKLSEEDMKDIRNEFEDEMRSYCTLKGVDFDPLKNHFGKIYPHTESWAGRMALTKMIDMYTMVNLMNAKNTLADKLVDESTPQAATEKTEDAIRKRVKGATNIALNILNDAAWTAVCAAPAVCVLSYFVKVWFKAK
jgi:hypothetical protein